MNYTREWTKHTVSILAEARASTSGEASMRMGVRCASALCMNWLYISEMRWISTSMRIEYEEEGCDIWTTNRVINPPGAFLCSLLIEFSLHVPTRQRIQCLDVPPFQRTISVTCYRKLRSSKRWCFLLVVIIELPSETDGMCHGSWETQEISEWSRQSYGALIVLTASEEGGVSTSRRENASVRKDRFLDGELCAEGSFEWVGIGGVYDAEQWRRTLRNGWRNCMCWSSDSTWARNKEMSCRRKRSRIALGGWNSREF